MKYIIVGGTSGIGLATAKMAVESGHSVVAVGRDPGKFVAAQTVGATTAQLDASDFAASQRLFLAEGDFDHLVLCASGAAGAGQFRDLALEDLRKGFEGKFWPQVTCAKAALPTLRAGGSITFVGAISSRALKPGHRWARCYQRGAGGNGSDPGLRASSHACQCGRARSSRYAMVVPCS